MGSPEKTMVEFTADMKKYIDAGVAYRKAATLAYSESARVSSEMITAALAGLPVEANSLLADMEGCKELGVRAEAAEAAFIAAGDKFYDWADRFAGKKPKS